MPILEDPAGLQGHPGREFFLEDYRMWLRELEKQDRWFAQNAWLVLSACAVALFGIQSSSGAGGALAAALVALVGSLFVSMNTDFLASRILSFRQVARRVAAVRAALGFAELLQLPPTVAYPGSPMLSINPESFVRTTYWGQGVGFRHLFMMNRTALAALYFGAVLVFAKQIRGAPTSVEPGFYTSLFVTTAFVHWMAFSLVFRWRISEAETLGEFIVTVARDRGVRVAADAEDRLRCWVRRRGDSEILSMGARAIAVIVAYEDKRFWWHPGIDVLAILSVSLGRHRGGATTIAMQLARQLIPAPHIGPSWGKLKRKVFETVLGIYLLRSRGRRFVLSSWLITIPFGRAKITGLEHAARAYFGKSVQDLDELDGLLLAERITVSTGRYYPDRIARLVRWAARRNLLGTCDPNDALARLGEMQKRVPT